MTDAILQVSDLSVYYNKKKALNSVSLSFQPKEITALIGPSGSGKSTLLKSLNRMGDLNPEVTTTGSVVYNGTFAHERAGVKDKQVLDEIVETSLRQAALWDQVKDDLHKSALTLSGGQQQRLCIARAISVKPDILLMDEPASALDPIATMQLEETMFELKKNFTIIIVTHNMQQAARASDYTGFFYLGDLIEYDKTATIFQNAKLQSTNDYVSGHFG
ncbi:phosphate transporter ATP-binding protein [Streptococcus pneumoniae]|nr:phosphate transporter ATP-binding protein [Streptococcus pneumoniae]